MLRHAIRWPDSLDLAMALFESIGVKTRDKGFLMSSLTLNMLQENELERLIEYERSTCPEDKGHVYRCAFPYRPQNDLQAELIDLGILAKKEDGQYGIVVVLTSKGYSYFPAKYQEEETLLRARKRDSHLIGLSAFFAALCIIVGFLLGKFFT